MWKHLHKHNIVLHFQHGFQSGLSCESQLIETVHGWMTAMDNKTQIDAILLDFAKAFNKVPHLRLLSKLTSYGITGNTQNSIKSFLSNRALSNITDVTSGVPQDPSHSGSVGTDVVRQLVRGPPTVQENGETTLEVKAPDTITSWVATAFAMHRESGLGITPTASKLTVFQPFFVSLNLPYSTIRGEEFGLQAMVFNYLPEAVEVKVTLSRSDSFKIRSVNDLSNTVFKEAIFWITVAPNDAQSAWFWIVPDQLGNIPIEVKAQSHLAADALRRMLLVKPEGTPQEYHKSVIVDFSKEAESLLETVNITFPPDLVEGSEYIKVTAIGDLMGTSIQGLGSLLQMPYGCGEQNMINFAPAIYIMDYLKATNQLTPEVKAKAVKVMESGYMRELKYQHTDGSFSAFGNSDKSGSMWLSAFVVKSFHQAKPYIFIDTNLIDKTLGWIIDRQNSNGSFSEPSGGRVIHTDMQGGSSKGVPLTAYVLIALVENNDVSGRLKTRVDNAIASAMAHLEDQMDDIEPYALAIVTYALAVGKSSKAPEALQKLNEIAIKMGGMMYWEMGKAMETETPVKIWPRPYHQAGASNIEMTAYGLLVYNEDRKLIEGIPILKWLASQRNPNGGFASTQDTVLALQAMAELSAMAFGGDSLRLDVGLDAGDIHYKYETITKANAGIMQSKQLPGNTDKVVISANGTGLGIVQVAVSYNVIDADNKAGVLVTIGTKDKGNGISEITVCGKYTKKEASGMTVMEVGLVSGNKADTNELVKQVPTLKRVENKDSKVVLYFDEFTKRDTCVKFFSQQVVPLTNPKNAYIEGYQYYHPGERLKEFKKYLIHAWARRSMSVFAQGAGHLNEASYRISHSLARHQVPLAHAKVFNTAFLAGAEVVFVGFPNKEKSVEQISKLPLSADTCARRCESGDVFKPPLSRLRACPTWSIALDENTNRTHIAQWLVYVQYFDNGISEDILGLILFKGTTTAATFAMHHCNSVELDSLRGTANFLFKVHAESGNFLHFQFTREVCGEDEARTEDAKQVLVGVLDSRQTAFNKRFVGFAYIDDVCCFFASPFASPPDVS
ncbi:CD109 antigen [Lamellibrachia satsuma]|nr:CD109 antigen [Lamellibrachia satsuma]